MAAFKSSFKSMVMDLVYPSKCALCARFGPAAICSICLQEFQPLHTESRTSSEKLSQCFSLYRHEGRAAQAVRRLKYSRATSLIDPLAELMRQGYEQIGLDEFDFVVPIPIHWRRRAMRDFNQAEALASKLPKEKVRQDVLTRVKYTKPQVGLSREARIRNLSGAFAANPQVQGRSVLLIDDVMTTGHTAEECAQALQAQGAGYVGLLTLTREV